MPSEQPGNVVTGRFGAPAADPLDAAAALGFRALAPQREVSADAYLDTPAFALLRAGVSLRLRGSEGRVEVALASVEREGFDDEVERVELGGPVADVARPLDPAVWPDGVRERVRAAAGDAPGLRFICLLHQQRDRVPLVRAQDAEGPVVATIELEEVRVLDPRDAPDPTLAGIGRLLEDGEPVASFTEVDVEPLEPAADQLVRGLSARMREIPDVVVRGGGKLEHALRELAGRPRIDPAMAMAEAARGVWRRQLLVLLLGEAGARRGRDPEYVHEMRVATRHARAAGRTFGRFFRRKALRPFLDGLRRTARELGSVRDADVKLGKLRKYARSRPDEEQQALAEIRAVWRVERMHAQRSLIAWLDGDAYGEFVVGFSELCGTPGMGVRRSKRAEGEAAPRDVGHVLPSAILARFEKVRSYADQFDGSGPVSVSALHALRIDCKELRYILQPVGHLLGGELAPIRRRLKDLQEVLGDLNDAAVADAALDELEDIVEPEGVAAYRAHLRSSIADLAARAPEAWRALVAPDNRERLAVALARM